MSYGTTLNNVYLDRIRPEGIKDSIEDVQDNISSAREELMMFVGSAPRDTKDEDGNIYRWEEYALNRTRELMSFLAEQSILLYKYSLIQQSAPEDIDTD